MIVMGCHGIVPMQNGLVNFIKHSNFAFRHHLGRSLTCVTRRMSVVNGNWALRRKVARHFLRPGPSLMKSSLWVEMIIMSHNETQLEYKGVKCDLEVEQRGQRHQKTWCPPFVCGDRVSSYACRLGSLNLDNGIHNIPQRTKKNALRKQGLLKGSPGMCRHGINDLPCLCDMVSVYVLIYSAFFWDNRRWAAASWCYITIYCMNCWILHELHTVVNYMHVNITYCWIIHELHAQVIAGICWSSHNAFPTRLVWSHLGFGQPWLWSRLGIRRTRRTIESPLSRVKGRAPIVGPKNWIVGHFWLMNVNDGW